MEINTTFDQYFMLTYPALNVLADAVGSEGSVVGREVNLLRFELRKLRAAAQAVADLHSARDYVDWVSHTTVSRCAECGQAWPCATLKERDRAMLGDQ